MWYRNLGTTKCELSFLDFAFPNCCEDVRFAGLQKVIVGKSMLAGFHKVILGKIRLAEIQRVILGKIRFAKPQKFILRKVMIAGPRKMILGWAGIESGFVCTMY